MKARSAAERVRAAKWALIIVGSLLLLLVAAVVVITSVVDPDRYRGHIESLVAERLGRPLVIQGHLGISWFPWLGLRTGPAHLGNRAGESGSPMIEWQSIAVAAKLVPLLKGQVVIGRIRLQSPQIRLRVDAQGHGNWEDWGPDSKSSYRAAPPGERARPGATPHETEPLHETDPSRQELRQREAFRHDPLLQIAGLEIRDGTLTYEDESSGVRINLSNLQLDVGEWRLGQPVPVHARFLAHGGSVQPDGVWVQADAPALAVRVAPLNIEAPELTIRIADADIRGNLRYRQAQTTGGPEGNPQISANGSTTVHAPSVRKLAAELGLNQTMPHDPTTLGPLELKTDWSYDNSVFAARPVLLKLDDVTLQGWVEHSGAPRSAWRFELRGDRIDLDRYVQVDSSRKKSFQLDMLKAINANGSLIFKEVELADAHLSDVRLRFETPATQPAPE